MTYDNVKRMIELSKEKKSILNEILEITKLQKDFIENEQMEELNEALLTKEKLIEKIDIIDKEFLNLYNQIKMEEQITSLDKIDIQKYSNIKSLKEIVSEINTILNNISIIDKNNTTKMKSNVDKIKSDLKQVKEAKRAYKGYNYEAVGSMLIDEKK
ncbi:flagellar export chaperone FlgN [Tissierella sp. MB52-C2]|uniref:flagellar protein FlgN n=1 Tax=Tissierella sp. MB52-C2 TaxID=3070999 RepID=UPI00280B6BED|nr:flagellar export chaperone FlgN [Tissierella sp. MB52-C2]WMM24154.1 flagellar export chaperone FlgN [Tissierella sp. MB52-C2]